MAETGTRIRIKKPWVTHEPEGPSGGAPRSLMTALAERNDDGDE